MPQSLQHEKERFTQTLTDIQRQLRGLAKDPRRLNRLSTGALEVG
jgi:hypothetical protein